MEYNDEELVMLAREEIEEAKAILYDKYKYIIDIEIKKYLNAAKSLGYDLNELYQDALVGFSDGIKCYREDKASSLPTFITLCVDRKLQYAIRSVNNKKNKFNKRSLSLEDKIKNTDIELKEIISDNYHTDPLNQIVKKENLNNLTKKIESKLSKNEKEVYDLLIKGTKYREIATILGKEPKQIDNAIQRIKQKIKKILEYTETS